MERRWDRADHAITFIKEHGQPVASAALACLEARLNESWRAGIGANFIGVAQNLNGNGFTGALEVATYVGYSWKPASNDQ
jgi:hypothetical protein